MDTRSEMAAMVNLMAHPMAGLASASAIGMGLASQMMGMWLGTVMGSAAVARRLMEAAPQPVAQEPAATETTIADARAKVIQLSAVSAQRGKAARREPPAARPVAAARPAQRAETRRKAVAAVAEAAQPADDLKLIPGIGPKLEQALKRLGIATFAKLAALSEAEAAGIDAQLGLNGRIARDAWIAQARQRIAGGAA